MSTQSDNDISAFIDYFKSLVERKEDAQHWEDWFSTHEKELSQNITPGALLRLRMNPLPEIYRLLSESGVDYPQPKNYVHPKFRVLQVIPASWLVERVSKEEIVAMIKPDKLNRLSDELAIIMSEMKPSDEFWHFSSPSKTWANLAGRSGIAIVRNGVPLDSIVLMMN